MANTQIFGTFNGAGVPNNPPVPASNYETNPWVLTRINDPLFTQLLIDLASIRPPRLLTEATGDPSQRGGALAILISLPAVGSGNPALSQLFVWSDTESHAAGTGIVVPFNQPSGYNYGTPANGRWVYWTSTTFGGGAVGCGVVNPASAPILGCALYVNILTGTLWYWDSINVAWVQLIGP